MVSVPFSMAFQPIVDVASGAVFAYEALVRGPAGEGAQTVLSAINDGNRYAFDQNCRVKAIELASQLGLARDGALLSINFLPNAVYEPRACIRLTLAAAARCSVPLHALMFEFTENEVLDVDHVKRIIHEYRSIGFKVALDDFGAGHAGLGLLAKIKPDIVKLDMELVRGIDDSSAKQTIVKFTVRMLDELGIVPICEGVETVEELTVLRDLGVKHIQGYLFAKPGFEALPAVAWPAMPGLKRAG
jgi:EAL domain-containing protein (putative c-di-GMP-specific phosphodiesterase class I)